MTQVATNGIHIEYETFGEPDSPTLLLIIGIIGQLTFWDEEWLRNFVAQSYDRAFNPEGTARQFVAILAQKNRRPALKSLSTPALVIHGADDPLVLVEGGKNTAADIPGAELMIIDGMGHDLPHGGAWPKIIDAIADFTRKTSITHPSPVDQANDFY